jgi:hypothetical protein
MWRARFAAVGRRRKPVKFGVLPLYQVARQMYDDEQQLLIEGFFQFCRN